eukprot:TRINITY_DN34505_c0_g1_i1.p1 TRINITY_DN34505_c0_g1~~TRINITY_DN34505_c0_g1_i1.p1  ORF type:complete len:147 (+),score=28.34 TRINITY_DN34505_c0_g1_i1:61-501(+)
MKRIKLRFHGTAAQLAGTRRAMLAVPPGVETVADVLQEIRVLVEGVEVAVASDSGDTIEYLKPMQSITDEALWRVRKAGEEVAMYTIVEEETEEIRQPSPLPLKPPPASLVRLRREQNEHYKTKPCRNWSADGECRYGKRCKFAHE